MPKLRKIVRPQVKLSKSAASARRRELAAWRRGKIRPYRPKPIPALLRLELSPKIIPKRRKPQPSAEELARRRTPATRAELAALVAKLKKRK